MEHWIVVLCNYVCMIFCALEYINIFDNLEDRRPHPLVAKPVAKQSTSHFGVVPLTVQACFMPDGG